VVSKLETVAEQVVNNYNFIYDQVRYFCSEEKLVEDYAMDVVVKIIKGKQEKVYHKQYFSLVAKHVVISGWRKKQDEVLISETPDVPTKRSIESDYEIQEKLSEIKAVMTDTEWEIITLLSEGYSRKEIAELTSIKQLEVKNIIERVRYKGLKFKV
jgi:DNA-directed RNA polymerase specialized sigma24 family protein